jgi:hypothetical protein
MGSSHILDQLDICFDDTHAVANAGLLLPATLAERGTVTVGVQRQYTGTAGRVENAQVGV